MVEIFFGLTKTHIHNFETILKNRTHSKENNYRVLITDNDCYNKIYWDRIILSKQPFLKKGSNQLVDLYYLIKKVVAYKRIINNIKPYKKENNIKIYIAYIEDILSNYLFFSFHQNTKAIIVEDGILNYYKHTMSDISKVRFFLKKCISFIFEIPFRSYVGHSSGIEYQKAVKQYLSNPELAFIKKNTEKLNYSTFHLENPKNELFIVGLENLVQLEGIKTYKKIFKDFLIELKDYIQDKEIKNIYYKPRNRCLDFEYYLLNQFFEEYNLIIINDKKIAEIIYFQDLQSKYIASFISSTLFTIYTQVNSKDRKKLKFLYKPVNDHVISDLYEQLHFIKLCN